MSLVIVPDKLAGQSGFLFLIPEPGCDFFRVHVGNRDHKLRIIRGFTLNCISHGMNENTIRIRDQFTSPPVKISAHAPLPA